MRKDDSGTVYGKRRLLIEKQWDTLRQRVKEGISAQGHDILLVQEDHSEQRYSEEQ